MRLDVDAGDLSHVLAPAEHDRASRFYRVEDRRKYVVAHAMLRRILALYEQSSPESLQLTVEEFGKPALASSASGEPRLQFNLSHSGELALVAVARGRRVGVDVEQWRTTFPHAELARKVLSANEQATFRALAGAPEREVAGFYSAWSRKEAYIKATGHGISRGLQHFDVTLATDEDARLVADQFDDAAPERWTMRALVVGAGYSAAVVVESPADEILLYDAR